MAWLKDYGKAQCPGPQPMAAKLRGLEAQPMAGFRGHGKAQGFAIETHGDKAQGSGGTDHGKIQG